MSEEDDLLDWMQPLRVGGFEIRGDPSKPWTQFTLFTDLHRQDLFEHLIRAGLNKDFPLLNDIELVLKISSYTKKNVSIEDPTDYWASLGWVMLHFYKSQRGIRWARRAGSLDDLVQWSLEQGRLIEWWRWRSSGHDARAVARLSSESALADAVGGRADRAAERRAAADAWRSRAIEIADDVRRRRPDLTASAVAQHVERQLREEIGEGAPKRETIRKALRESWDRPIK